MVGRSPWVVPAVPALMVAANRHRRAQLLRRRERRVRKRYGGLR